MQHSEFLNNPEGRNYGWRLTNWSSAVRIALGGKALLLFRSAFVCLLAPAVLLASYSLYWNRFALLILVIMSLWGFWTSSTGPTGIGMAASMLTATIGFVLSVFMQDKLLAFSSVLPGVSWFGSCAILGTTASYVTDAVRSSEATFHELTRRGILTANPKSEQSHALEPAAEPVSNGNSSPPDK